MNQKIRLLDVVALTEDLSGNGLCRGQVGTIVEVLAPGVFEVEFNDNRGATYATVAVPEAKLMALRHEPVLAA